MQAVFLIYALVIIKQLAFILDRTGTVISGFFVCFLTILFFMKSSNKGGNILDPVWRILIFFFLLRDTLPPLRIEPGTAASSLLMV